MFYLKCFISTCRSELVKNYIHTPGFVINAEKGGDLAPPKKNEVGRLQLDVMQSGMSNSVAFFKLGEQSGTR